MAKNPNARRCFLMTNNRYGKVLLVIAPMVASGANMYARLQFPAMPAAGIGYLSEFLSYHGIENDVIDLGLDYREDISASIAQLRRRIQEVKPDLIGFQVMTHRRDITKEIIDQIRSPDYDIVIGGVYISTVRERAMEEFPVDLAVKLEGEYTLLELCQGKDLDKIDNLIFRQDDWIIENKDRAYITDLDSIPFPKYSKFELGKYTLKCLSIASSRGCPYLCIYCSNPPTVGRKFRARSAENVIEEMIYWYKRGYREFDFIDDVFTLRKDRVYRICDLIEQNRLRHLKLHCENGVRADLVDRELLKRMKEVGFFAVNFGVESATNRMLGVIKKGETLEQIDKSIRDACELGYTVGICFLIGSPGETTADVRDSFNFALKHPVAWANFYNIVPYPRTELFEWLKKNNYFLGDWWKNLAYEGVFGQPLFTTPELSLEDRQVLFAEGAKISNETRKRAFLRSVKKFGPLGSLMVAAMYSDRLHPYLARLYHKNRVVNWTVNKLIQWEIIKVYHI